MMGRLGLWSFLILALIGRDLLVSDPEIKIIVSVSFKKHPNVEKLWARFGFLVPLLPPFSNVWLAPFLTICWQDRLVYVEPRKDTVYAEEVRRLL